MEPMNSNAFELSEIERSRIRAEIRYAALITRQFQLENRQPEKKQGVAEKIFSYLSNGFILLLTGTLITSGLVPYFQRKYENEKQRYSLKKECLTEFLFYSNSIWQEYYEILPLTQEVEINKDEYLKYIKKISEIKLKRYDAYAKVQALSVVFRQDNDGEFKDALEKYAIQLNNVSAAIDKWLTGLYCTPVLRDQSPCGNFDLSFNSFKEYEKIKNLVVKIGNDESENVAEIIVNKMKQ